MKRLTSTGITACATLHSPTAYAFALFDDLLLLVKGQVIYFGPNGEPAIQYFATHFPALNSVVRQQNTAEWVMTLTSQVWCWISVGAGVCPSSLSFYCYSSVATLHLTRTTQRMQTEQ